MKKILLFVFTFLFINSAYGANNLSFVYINGSNNNDTKMKTWYENGVHKLHPVLRKKFLKNSAVKKYYKAFGGLNIKEDPVIFFWGYKSKDDLEFVKNKLEISKAVSSSGAYFVRNLITEYLHDAIWVQKKHNMLPILDDLNNIVKQEAENGNDVILYGYSAGTFVTYEYMFNKLRYINIYDLFKTLKADDDYLRFIEENPMEDTCISALSDKYAKLGTITQSGHFLMNADKERLKKYYLKMNEMTELACAPKTNFKGIVNFASPLPLFYSDLGDPNYEINYYNKLMVKYLLENGIFMLTVNFREDPLGFPMSRNCTASEIEEILDTKIEKPTGVIYDNSSVWSKRMFPLAHTSYWTARRTFSNAIVKSFVNGYKFNYDEKYQQKVFRQNKKKSEL